MTSLRRKDANKSMKIIQYLFISITSLFFSSSCVASNDTLQLKIERAGRLIASTYVLGNPDEKLFGLNPDYFPSRPKDIISESIPITIVAKHSLSEEPSHPVNVKGFDQFSKWLNDVRDHFRFRDNLEARTMGTCINACCKYPLDGGISHNTLYITSACFSIENNIPYLKSITLLDGD
jgi:hypothetical protein